MPGFYGKLDIMQPKFGLKDLIGISSLKRLVTRDILASRISNETFPHTLLAGRGGLGKTEFAKAAVFDLGYWYDMIEGAMCKTRKQSQDRLIKGCDQARKNGKRLLFFVDEAHRLSKEAQEAFYIPMLTGQIEGTQLWNFTLFAATTHPHMLLGPFRSRLRNEWNFSRYEQHDIERMIVKWWRKNNLQWERKSVEMVAERSLGIPRSGYNLSQKIRNQVLARGGDRVVKEQDCSITFELEGIDKIGLTSDQVCYLRILSLTNSARGIGSIAGSLDREVEVVEESIEPVLLSLGFVDRLRCGRKITQAGFDHLHR